MAYIMECHKMFGGLNNEWYQCVSPFVNWSFTYENCLEANAIVFNAIVDILMAKKDGTQQVMFHMATLKLMKVHLWGGISCQHML